MPVVYYTYTHPPRLKKTNTSLKNNRLNPHNVHAQHGSMLCPDYTLQPIYSASTKSLMISVTFALVGSNINFTLTSPVLSTTAPFPCKSQFDKFSSQNPAVVVFTVFALPDWRRYPVQRPVVRIFCQYTTGLWAAKRTYVDGAPWCAVSASLLQSVASCSILLVLILMCFVMKNVSEGQAVEVLSRMTLALVMAAAQAKANNRKEEEEENVGGRIVCNFRVSGHRAISYNTDPQTTILLLTFLPLLPTRFSLTNSSKISQ